MKRPALGHVRDDEAAGDAAVADEERAEREEEREINWFLTFPIPIWNILS